MCRYRGATCASCGVVGHLASVCRSVSRRDGRHLPAGINVCRDTSTSNRTTASATTLAAAATNATNTVRIKIGHHWINATVDTGASLSVISDSFFKLLNTAEYSEQTCSKPFLLTASGEHMPITKCVDLHLNINGLLLQHPFLVTPTLSVGHSVIIGLDLLTRFKCTVNLSENILW